MKIIKPNVYFMTPIDGDEILRHIEKCARTCYKSEDKITDGSAEKFVQNLIKRQHDATLEHASFTVKFVCDRGISHELVRHRLASFCQESTRYCNYSKDGFGNEITVIEPCYFYNIDRDKVLQNITNSIEERPDLTAEESAYKAWYTACVVSEKEYFEMLNYGCTPQEARAVLPNSLKTEVVMTANLREWRHFFKLRCAPAAHPQMREVACLLLEKCQEKIPIIFSDIQPDLL